MRAEIRAQCGLQFIGAIIWHGRVRACARSHARAHCTDSFCVRLKSPVRMRMRLCILRHSVIVICVRVGDGSGCAPDDDDVKIARRLGERCFINSITVRGKSFQ